jgi:fructose transport system substrate-binding protein
MAPSPPWRWDRVVDIAARKRIPLSGSAVPPTRRGPNPEDDAVQPPWSASRSRAPVARRPSHRARHVALTAVLILVAVVGTACGRSDLGGVASTDTRIGVSLITKDSTNPYFVAMQAGARKEAEDVGVRLTVTSGEGDHDVEGQVAAVEASVERGDRGIVITPVSHEVDDALTQARLAGLYVIALDTPPEPADVVDVTFASDNREAGRLLGAWVAGTLAGRPADLALLDLFGDRSVSVDLDRDQGFLEGLGIDVGDPDTVGDEAATGGYTGGEGGDYAITCRHASGGTEEGGRRAMESCLRDGGEIGVVYAVNEPTAFGAVAALRAAGAQDVLVVTVDGSCAGVAAVRDGTFGATVQQDPVEMATLGVSSIAKIARGGVKPSTSEGLGFRDTGVELVTDVPVGGVPSVDSDNGMRTCWG